MVLASAVEHDKCEGLVPVLHQKFRFNGIQGSQIGNMRGHCASKIKDKIKDVYRDKDGRFRDVYAA